ncbi:hypothetical protein Ahy_B04g070775 isoform C [Arachis hypogaea]|uniref:Uncharacterized protein n=1 Tax=Arachis hypogaea TaxID=3818 RepID=A0A444ZJ76_ARAHY|nr:hypothetical protein Ahy_B04g070775 isoform C [Arachis hypogaea]
MKMKRSLHLGTSIHRLQFMFLSFRKLETD